MKIINGARLGMCCNIIASKLDLKYNDDYKTYKDEVKKLYDVVGEIEQELANEENN